jgi:hypothetical protein
VNSGEDGTTLGQRLADRTSVPAFRRIAIAGLVPEFGVDAHGLVLRRAEQLLTLWDVVKRSRVGREHVAAALIGRRRVDQDQSGIGCGLPFRSSTASENSKSVRSPTRSGRDLEPAVHVLAAQCWSECAKRTRPSRSARA